jgi:hypothetical protein
MDSRKAVVLKEDFPTFLFSFAYFAEPGMEPRALHILGKHSTTNCTSSHLLLFLTHQGLVWKTRLLDSSRARAICNSKAYHQSIRELSRGREKDNLPAFQNQQLWKGQG